MFFWPKGVAPMHLAVRSARMRCLENTTPPGIWCGAGSWELRFLTRSVGYQRISWATFIYQAVPRAAWADRIRGLTMSLWRNTTAWAISFGYCNWARAVGILATALRPVEMGSFTFQV